MEYATSKLEGLEKRTRQFAEIVRVGDKTIAHQLRRENGAARIVLNEEIRLEAGDRLTVSL